MHTALGDSSRQEGFRFLPRVRSERRVPGDERIGAVRMYGFEIGKREVAQLQPRSFKHGFCAARSKS